MADSASYYRDEARRCRMMARTAKTGATSRRWAELADEYEQLAVARERGGRPPARGSARSQPQPVQQQPVQQQQSKLRPDEP
jgi:hypothetical protein